MNVFDFDGVVSTGNYSPQSNDVIVTGRCFDECEVVYSYLQENNLSGVAVFFNPISISFRGDHTIGARTISGLHKTDVIDKLRKNGCFIDKIYEDDPLQAKLILNSFPNLELILVEKSVEY